MCIVPKKKKRIQYFSYVHRLKIFCHVLTIALTEKYYTRELFICDRNVPFSLLPSEYWGDKKSVSSVKNHK